MSYRKNFIGTQNEFVSHGKPASVAQLDACQTGDQEVAGSTPSGSATFFRGDEIFSAAILFLPLIQVGQLLVSGEKKVHNTG